MAELVKGAVPREARSISSITAGHGLIFRVATGLLQYHKDCYGLRAVSKRNEAKEEADVEGYSQIFTTAIM
jgi:hypothetical protein